MLRTVRRTLAVTLLVATTTGGLALAAAPAYAIGPTTISRSGTILTVTAAAGTDNNLFVAENAQGFFVRDLAGGVRPAAGSGCANVNGTGQASCVKAGITELVVDTGDFDDRIGLGAPAGSSVRYEVNLGSGTDAAAVNTPHSTVHGGAGPDNLSNTSRQFSAVLDGGDGADRCARGTPGDRLVGCETVS